MQFNEFQLDPRLLQAVEAAGFTIPTPIQEQAIPAVLSGRDLMASAQTGTGKTAAFVLPILDRLLKPSQGKGKGPRVLVLTPTRELAGQVNEDIRKFSRFCQFTTGTVVGGLSYNPQIQMLRRPLDLLVATPGRLMDHMDSGLVDFSRLEVFVLDEADRMLDMGFIRDVRKIAADTPDTRQTLLFSATLEGEVLTMGREVTRDPVSISLAVNTRRHDDIRQHVYQADDADHKHRLLNHHLDCETLAQAVVFTRTKRRADRLAKKLSQEGRDSGALHGDMTQAARKRTIDKMRAGRLQVLVATDVAARGLDISGISHVVNFDMPMVAEDYIHRIGRTGRAGATGKAISFVGPEDWEYLTGVQRLTGWDLARETIPGLEPATPEPSPNSFNRKRKRGGGGSSRGRYSRDRNGAGGNGNKRFGNRSNGNGNGNGHSNGNGNANAPAADTRSSEPRPANTGSAPRKKFGARSHGSSAATTTRGRRATYKRRDHAA